MSATNDLLMAFLECGYDDIHILDDVRYDLKDIVDSLNDLGIKPTLNEITNEIFTRGQEELKEAVFSEIKNTEDQLKKTEESSKEYERLEEKLNALRILNPEVDIGWICNCSDTDCYFIKNEEIYRTYLENKISDIEDLMGFEFC